MNLDAERDRLLALAAGLVDDKWIAVHCMSPRHAASVAYENRRGAEFVMVHGCDDSHGGPDSWDAADKRDEYADLIAAVPEFVALIRAQAEENALLRHTCERLAQDYALADAQCDAQGAEIERLLAASPDAPAGEKGT